MDSQPQLPEVRVAGTPARMGEAWGEASRADAQALYHIRLDSAIRFAAERGHRAPGPAAVLAAAGRCLAIADAWDAAVSAEFHGIARGAGLSPAQLYVLNGLTDLRDLLAWPPADAPDGCSALAVLPDRAAGPWILGQNWDLQTSNMPYIRLVHRHPDQGPPTISLTLSGCLSLIGMNAHGVAVGNTNLQCHDPRPGVQYLHLIHRALACDSAAAAAAVFHSAPRLAAHYYYVGGPGGPCLAIECSGGHSHQTRVASGVYVHCNHALCPTVAAVEVPADSDSSSTRQTRLQQLLQAHEGPIGLDALRAMLSDHAGGDQAICRHDVPPGLSTNACVLMRPDRREIHACRAQPHIGAWLTRTCT